MAKLGRPRKNAAAPDQSNSEITPAGTAPVATVAEKEAPKESSAKSDYPEEVTFIWNKSIKELKVVMQEGKNRYTDQGFITDTERPAKRLSVCNGMYTTSDPEKIAFLTGHDAFNTKGPDGFSILKKLSPKEELQALMDRTGITKEQVAEMAGKE